MSSFAKEDFKNVKSGVITKETVAIVSDNTSFDYCLKMPDKQDEHTYFSEGQKRKDVVNCPKIFPGLKNCLNTPDTDECLKKYPGAYLYKKYGAQSLRYICEQNKDDGIKKILFGPGNSDEVYHLDQDAQGNIQLFNLTKNGSQCIRYEVKKSGRNYTCNSFLAASYSNQKSVHDIYAVCDGKVNDKDKSNRDFLVQDKNACNAFIKGLVGSCSTVGRSQLFAISDMASEPQPNPNAVPRQSSDEGIAPAYTPSIDEAKEQEKIRQNDSTQH
jgi:hypothetical protein